MALHKNLSGADLHEPKGIETAPNGSVYVANGSGTGTWQDRYSGLYDKNDYYIHTTFVDISNPSSVFFAVPTNSELINLSVVLYGPITVTNTTISIYLNGVLFAQTLTVPYSGSTVGSISTLTSSTSNTLPAGSVVELRSDGASSTTAIASAVVGLRAKP